MLGLNKIPPLILVFFIIDFGLCAAYLANYLIGQPLWTLTLLLDLESESSVASWYSSIQLFCVFLVGMYFNYHKNRQDNASRLLILLPLLFLLLSLDEAVGIHEWLGSKSDMLFSTGSRDGSAFSTTGIWMFVVGIPFMACFFFLIYLIKQNFSDTPSSLRKLVVGMIVMLAGALGFETLVNFIDLKSYKFIELFFEEGLEMVGVTIMLWAMYDVAIKYVQFLGFDNDV